MNKSLAALFLVIAGIVLCSIGYNRRQSVAGIAETFGKDIATKFDGKARAPEHFWYFAGGGALILAGVIVAAKK